jgi:hypothetical protein
VSASTESWTGRSVIDSGPATQGTVGQQLQPAPPRRRSPSPRLIHVGAPLRARPSLWRPLAGLERRATAPEAGVEAPERRPAVPERRETEPTPGAEVPEWPVDALEWSADEPEIVLYDAHGRVVSDPFERAPLGPLDDQRRRGIYRWLGGAVLGLVALGLVIGVGVYPRARGPESLATAPVADHAGAARNAIAERRWAVAAEHLRAALRSQPDSLFLRYNLAIAASWLDARDEAIREFEWVVAHAASPSEETRTAQVWLAQNRDAAPKAAESATAPKAGSAGVHGAAMWADAGSEPKPASRLQLFLIGVRDAPTGREYRVLRSDREGHFVFKDLVPGPYKLTDAIAGQPKWRLKVVVEAGQDLALDLTPENSTQRRDDFPEGK